MGIGSMLLYLAKGFRLKGIVAVLLFSHWLWECFALQDSGQPIPLVVESCIRYINLYGNLLFDSLFLTLRNFKRNLCIIPNCCFS